MEDKKKDDNAWVAIFFIVLFAVMWIGVRMAPKDTLSSITPDPFVQERIKQVVDPSRLQATSIYSKCPNGCTEHIDGCDVKGNVAIDTGIKYYHLPGDPFYDATVITPSKGDRWFCFEGEAEHNGFTYANGEP